MSGTPPERYGCPKCMSVFRSGYPRCPLDGGVLQTLTEDPLIGTVLAERYVIESLIGEGGMGRVYKARHVRMSRRFAVKILFGEHASDAKSRSRFAREAEACSMLTHPNVIAVVDFGETDEGLLYLVMDFVEGEELHQIVTREAPMSAPRCLSLLRQMARGLAHAHERGLVHRDFKTENVLITRDADGEIARIVDFGIAVVAEVAQPDSRLTTDGMVLGTPAYMSPEQACGEELDERSDLFSLGVILYELLCGRLPFDGTPLAMAKANLGSPVPFIGDRVPGLEVDGVLEGVALKLMAKSPDERFTSAAELLSYLDVSFGRRPRDTEPDLGGVWAGLSQDDPNESAAGSVAGEARSAKPYLPVESTDELVEVQRADARRRWVLGGVAMVAVMAAVAGVFWLKLSGGTDDNRGEVLAPLAGDGGAVQAMATPADAGPAVAQGDVVDAGLAVVQADAGLADAGAGQAVATARSDRRGRRNGGGKGSRSGKRGATGKDGGSERATGSSDTTEQGGVTASGDTDTSAGSVAAAVSPAQFDKNYRRVGNMLDDLTKARGDRAAAALRDRYFAIPYADALRSESVRRDADRALRRLTARIRAALAQK